MLSAALVLLAIAVLIWARGAFPVAVLALVLSTVCNVMDHRTPATRPGDHLRPENPPQ